eukprot:CAMPEP_0172784196 /NCGR_PEP_ID=MMETSP1074-20121228/204822_1 /TAXON_ID=2916 /ORGANISM="Ceratium fusus, Strain PA161109" /LENGTH=345 /DNA_ID=CAMNT_0013621199 /DNA_START=113 /DNA_END=1152 /DNA_ORIENTATION=-
MRPRWADIRDSSNDDSYAEPPCVPPLATDSYREAPEASLENSRVGLNQWLRCASELKEAPTDFAFLLTGAGGESLSENPVPEEPAPEATVPEVPVRDEGVQEVVVVAAAERGVALDAALDLHVQALLLVRRDAATKLKHTKQQQQQQQQQQRWTQLRSARPSSAVGASGCSNEAEAHEAAAAAAAAAPSPPVAALEFPSALEFPLAVGTAVDAATDSDEADGDASEIGASVASLKRIGQPGAQAPAGKRSRGGSDGSVPLRRLPEASEGTWQRRAEKRQLSVTAGKATPEYAAYTENIPREHRISENPQTPDPMDRTVSKRQWDEGVRLWRLALRQWAGRNSVSD